jgi:hypothetical protein
VPRWGGILLYLPVITKQYYLSTQCEAGGSCAALGQDTVAQHMAGYSEAVAAAKDQVQGLRFRV